MIVWFLALAIMALSIVETIGDSLIKYSGNNPERYVQVSWLIGGMIVYACAAGGWFFVFKHVKLGSIGMIYALTTIVALTVFGMIFFHETYSKSEMLGMALGFIALLLLVRAL